MSGLAKVLLNRGGTVRGSDIEDSFVVDMLRAQGAEISTGHSAANIADDVDRVVISAAVKETNPELAEARRRGLRVIKYAEMLGEIMDSFKGIAAAGTHGKSTTSGWLSFILENMGLSPGYVVGAEILQLQSSSGSGKGDIFVAEACEYDRSFLNLRPMIGVILNIEQDHLDYYKDEQDIISAFTDFARGIRSGGRLVANGQDDNVRRVIDEVGGEVEVVTFGIEGDFDFSAVNVREIPIGHEFDIIGREGLIGRAVNPLGGEHNIKNLLAAVAAAVSAGLDAGEVIKNAGLFTGMDRRMMLKSRAEGVTVVDDYAHHPTEIRVSLKSLRERYGPAKLWCVFQPHQYSRTRFLLDDFAESFMLCDTVIVPEIYFVRDTAEAKQKVNSEVLVERINGSGGKAVFIDDFHEIVNYLLANARTGDLIVTMGAGDIWKVADEYIQRTRRDS